MTEKWEPVLVGPSGGIRVKQFRAFPQGEVVGQYTLRVGNRVPARDPARATLPMPTNVSANNISTNGFQLAIEGGDYLFETSHNDQIIGLGLDVEPVFAPFPPGTIVDIEVVAIRRNGEFSLPFPLSVQTKSTVSDYPYEPGAAEPVRDENDAALFAPRFVALEFIDSMNARISWSGPEDDEEIDAYEVVFAGQIVGVQTGGFVDISGLTPLTQYTASVRSVNDKNEFSMATTATRISPATVVVPLPQGTIDVVEGDYRIA